MYRDASSTKKKTLLPPLETRKMRKIVKIWQVMSRNFDEV